MDIINSVSVIAGSAVLLGLFISIAHDEHGQEETRFGV